MENKKTRIIIISMFLAICMLCRTLNANPAMAAELALGEETVVVGKQISFEGNLEGYTFKSSDEQIAYISSSGVVTAKQQGEVIITAVKEGKKLDFPITVMADGKKPALKVCRDELFIKKPFVSSKDGKNVMIFIVKNQSTKGSVKKLICRFRCTVFRKGTEKDAPLAIQNNIMPNKDGTMQDNMVMEERTITVSFDEIGPDESSSMYFTEIEGLMGLHEETLEAVTVYSGDAKLTWDEVSASVTEYDWAIGRPTITGDKKPPVIKGFVGSKSYNGKDVFVTLYADRKTAYKKYVTAYDKHDGKVPVKADLSKINWNKNGTYTITVSASDKAGNKAEKKMRVQVRCIKGIDLYADRILKQITKPKWSDKAKCKAIYRYVQSHMRYVNYNGGKSWESAALRGLRYSNGNCYAYYSLSRLLLTRAGIPNLMVTRYPAVPNHHHWWNLAYVKGGWYHFDTTPRRLRGRFCLLTDAQLGIYEQRSPGTYRYARNEYPKRAGKVICEGPF